MLGRLAVARDDVGPVEEAADGLGGLLDPLELEGGDELRVDPGGAGNAVDLPRDLERPARVLLVGHDLGLFDAEGADGLRDVVDLFLLAEIALGRHAAVEERAEEALGNAAMGQLADVRPVLLHLLEERRELGSGHGRAGHLRGERPVLAEPAEKELGHLLLVLEVRLFLVLGDLVERRLRDVEEALVDERGHVAEEERQQQRPDVRAVDVGVGHDDDLVVADLPGVEVRRDPRSERRDEGPDLGRGEHLVEPRLLDVQDLAAQRQDRLGAAVAAHLGRAAGRVALDDEELGERGILLLAVGQLAGQGPRIESALPADELAGFASGFAGAGGFDDLLDDPLADARVLLEVGAQLVVDDLLDPGLHFGRDQLVLRL